MALEQHMSETARLFIEGAKGITLPIAERHASPRNNGPAPTTVDAPVNPAALPEGVQRADAPTPVEDIKPAKAPRAKANPPT